MKKRATAWSLFSVVTLVLTSCVTTITLPRPQELRLPQARHDSLGRYLSPYTRDGTLADWTDQAIKIKAKGQIAGAFGTIVGIALGGDPIFGTLLKSTARDAARSKAVKALGGWEGMRRSSDTSFDSADDLAVYLYAFYSAEKTYVDALDAAMTFCPDLAERYVPAIQAARKAGGETRR